jgi:hypothetical protein
MLRFFFASVLVAGLLPFALPAQEKKEDFKKDVSPKTDQPPTKKTSGGGQTSAPETIPGDVEVLFLNGSKVRVIIQTEKLDIATIYGKLTVPIQDVQAIEFGLHYPEGATEKINVAIKNLGSSDYRARELAAKTLMDFGPFAYPAVVRTTKVKETEVAARARDIVQKLQAKYSKKDLRTSVDDRVVTPTQTIVGHILTSTVKTKAEYFGEIEHKLANMRMLRAIIASPPEVDVTVDARKYANAGQWLDTAYQVDGRAPIVVTAKGQVDQWPQQPGQYLCGPSGMNGGRLGGGPGGGRIVMMGGNNGNLGGVLMGKIGEDGEPFIIGDRYEIKSETEGKLFLQIGPSPWGCPSAGSYEVKISRKGD